MTPVFTDYGGCPVPNVAINGKIVAVELSADELARRAEANKKPKRAKIVPTLVTPQEFDALKKRVDALERGS